MLDTASPTFPPVHQSLFRIDETQVSKSELMPGHWELYENILNLVDDESVVSGVDLPTNCTTLLAGLIDSKILIPAPLSYKKWQELKKAQQEKISREIDAEVSEIVTTINPTENSPTSDSTQEIDLDFLD